MNLFRAHNREEWREWLERNFKSETEIWLVFPVKAAGKGAEDVSGKETEGEAGKEIQDETGKGAEDVSGKEAEGEPGKEIHDETGKGAEDVSGKEAEGEAGKEIQDETVKGAVDVSGKEAEGEAGKEIQDETGKGAAEEAVTYNDAVEEALCFGWIDGTLRRVDEHHVARRITPRRKGSAYSQPNIERLRWLDEHGMIHPEIRPSVVPVMEAKFEFPQDIMEAIMGDPLAAENFALFSAPYRRIRVAYIDAARKRPEEFRRRLENFIAKTHKGQIISGYGGVDKYYR